MLQTSLLSHQFVIFKVEHENYYKSTPSDHAPPLWITHLKAYISGLQETTVSKVDLQQLFHNAHIVFFSCNFNVMWIMYTY